MPRNSDEELLEYTGEPLRPDFIDPTPPPNPPQMVGFMARFLVLATLPHSDPGTQARFGRANGKFSYYIESGTYLDEHQQAHPIGLPYGTLPRLLLCWLTTEAVQTRERELELGDRLAHFMERLSIKPTGGKWGSIPRLREQMKRFFSSKVSYSFRGKDGFYSGTVQVTSSAKTFWREDDKFLPTEGELGPLLFTPQPIDIAGDYQSRIVLGKEFFEEIIARPVPINVETVRKLRKSPLALDMYYWFTHRVYYLRKATTIPWDSLQKQFGCDFKYIHDFKKKFIKHLESVRREYPHLRTEVDLRRGVTLFPSHTHVPVELDRETRAWLEAQDKADAPQWKSRTKTVPALPNSKPLPITEAYPEGDPGYDESIEVPF